MGFWDAVTSAEPYANNLHLVPDRYPHKHPHHSSFTGRMLFLTPSQQCQSTEGRTCRCMCKYCDIQSYKCQSNQLQRWPDSTDKFRTIWVSKFVIIRLLDIVFTFSVNDKTAQQCPLIVWCLFRVRMWVGCVVPARRWVSLQHCLSTSSVACQTLTVTIDWLLNWSSWSTRSCDLSCASWLLTNSLSMNHSPLLLYDCSVYIQGGPLTASYYKLDLSYFIKIS